MEKLFFCVDAADGQKKAEQLDAHHALCPHWTLNVTHETQLRCGKALSVE